MTNPNDLAYPFEEEVQGEYGPMKNQYYGLSKREYFAAMAMQGLLANPTIKNEIGYEAGIANSSCIYADALIDSLNIGKP